MHSRIGLIAGGAALGLAAIAGCTSSSAGAGGSAGSAGTGSAAPGTAQGSAADTIKAALAKAANDKTVHLTGTISGSSVNGTLTGQEQFSPDAESALTISSSQFNLSEVLLGDALYLKIPQLGSTLGGKPWAKVNLSSMGSLGATFQAMLGSVKNTDPTQQLQPLLASGDVHKAGTETVDGVQADHYAGTVDPATAFDGSAAAKNLTPDQIAQLKSLMKQGGVTKETIDVWVGTADGLPVRETVSSSTAAGAVKVDMHLSQWGQPVSISAPPADQVTDISSMVGSLTASPGASAS